MVRIGLIACYAGHVRESRPVYSRSEPQCRDERMSEAGKFVYTSDYECSRAESLRHPVKPAITVTGRFALPHAIKNDASAADMYALGNADKQEVALRDAF